MEQKIALILCAAGQSSRFGGKTKKIFHKVNGQALFIKSAEQFLTHDSVKQIIMTVDADDVEKLRINHGAFCDFNGIEIVHGGKERCESVKNALAVLKDDINVVAVHDAARCCIRRQWLDAVFDKATQTGAAMLAAPVTATLKRTEGDIITETVDRRGMFEAQTPQVFRRDMLEKAYEKLNTCSDIQAISDDSMLVEMLGEKVGIVKTDYSNLKVTVPGDVPIVEAILKAIAPKEQKPLGAFEEAQW